MQNGRKDEENKKRLKNVEDKLRVKDVINKKTLVVLKYVLDSNTDADIKTALQLQNKHVLEDLSKQNYCFEIMFRERTKNAQISHTVLRVTPLL